MPQKNLLLSIGLLVFALISCNPLDNEDEDDFFPNNPPVTSAVFIVPTGTAATADNTTPYFFTVNIDRVNGPIGFGEFTAVLNSPTGTVDIAGLAIVFDSFTQTGPQSFSTRGTVTGPFVGQGTVNVTVTYTEYGIVILSNSTTFTVTITGPTEFSVCDLALFPIENLADYDATITVTGGPTSLADVNVLIDITAIFFGNNVELILTHSNTSVLLSDLDNVDTVLFDDETFISISESFNASGFGTFAPREPLSLFNGINSNGDWTLSGDSFSTSSIILNQWCLIFDEAPTPTPIPLDPTSNCSIVSAPIPDGGSSIPSVINLSGPTFIQDVNITGLDITHPRSGQLTITLESPEGTVVTLSSGNGGTTDVYNFIILDDRASNPITGITNPASLQAFFPEEALSAFNGEDATGDWLLTITDTAPADGMIGTLNQWCLQFDGIRQAR